jgi:hypothetical protein
MNMSVTALKQSEGLVGWVKDVCSTFISGSRQWPLVSSSLNAKTASASLPNFQSSQQFQDIPDVPETPNSSPVISTLSAQIAEEKPAEILKEKQIRHISPSVYFESGFSCCKCIAVAALIAGVAAISFALKFSVTSLCTAIAVWCVFTATVIVLHRVSEGTLVGRPIKHLYAVVMERNASLMATVLFPLTFFQKYHNATGFLTGRPILLINGFMSFASTWQYLRCRLSKEGLGPVYTMNIGSGRSIKTYAGYIKDRVLEIQKITGRKDIILVGHSKGGLVSSYFATHYAKEIDAKVTDVVVIGSPFKGTPFACVAALAYDGSEMTPESSLLKELSQAIEKEKKNIKFSYIGSECDGTVSIDSSIPDANADRKFKISDLGHVSLLFSSRVARQVCLWIKESVG